jgi:hypothetical protein
VSRCSKTKARCRLRGAVKTVNRVLWALDLEKHPDKTFIDWIERGFDFLGYRFTRAGLSLARKTFQNFIEKASRLYEQECCAALPATALEMCCQMWVQWATGGLFVASFKSALFRGPVEAGGPAGGSTASYLGWNDAIVSPHGYLSFIP